MQKDQTMNLKHPGAKRPLPSQIRLQLQCLHRKYETRLTFFGGHPVSMTRSNCNTIFSPQSLKARQSSFLVCEKTDGVRYILIITRNGHYFISREGRDDVLAYEAHCDIETDWPHPKVLHGQNSNSPFKEIVQILDGELIEDTCEDTGNSIHNTNNQQGSNAHITGQNGTVLRFLVFDILVHLGTQVTRKVLKERIEYVNKFMKANQLRKVFAHHHQDQNNSSKKPMRKIQVKVKDFFRLTNHKFLVTEFLLKNYIKCLPHQNDGLIFNDENKEYIFGMNEGYVKWKPPHLNTMDFYVVPNEKLIDRFGRKVIDLYLGYTDNEQSGSYTRVFYNFTVVPQPAFEQILKRQKQILDSIYESSQQGETTVNYFAGVIAQCSFKPTSPQERQIFKDLLPTGGDPEQIREAIMKANFNDQQLETVKNLQKIIYTKCWQIDRIRNDKSLPNNINVAKRIEKSIEDNINETELIKKNKQLMEEAMKR